MKHRRLALLLGATVLAGCVQGPDYQRPARPAPAAWEHPANEGTVLPDRWWALFGDDELGQHVDATLAANQDLAGALARYDQARALLGVARADEFPQVSLDPAYLRGRTSGTVSNALPALETTLYRVPVDVAYEVDLWGRVRRSVEAAQADVESGADSVATLRLSLAAATASTYLSLRSADRDIDVLVRTVSLRDDALKLADRRAHAGVVSDLDVLRARADLAQTRADLADAHRRRDNLEHALAVLEARDAPDFHVAPKPWTPTLPAIPAGLPSTLLTRRPDVASDEQALAAASARIGVARTAFFPSVQLTASAGFASNDAGDLTARDSRLWGIGPSIHLPIFEGGRNRARLEAAEAAYRGAYAHWRQDGIVAFREVQDALSDGAWLQEEGTALAATVEAATAAAKVSRSRYDRGLAGYFEVVDSERQALASQRAVIQNDQQRLLAAISLVKALGGGWKEGDPVPRQPDASASVSR
ncbi:efflux transporter outer membrane subunit [Luteibacter aegosomaticola]|uniref:efflux transporter outer membrane subunit n=1 Tax=Luteibacter aegosomaticola TaxID=2911538 RepID=UPI001FF835B8|nr:efflux transporter outer membrane subunit [Luteibacter aegosomaticola]UPG90327.1 efflux transporter outer membrane subunit [Luteibacter aegosomaticola]